MKTFNFCEGWIADQLKDVQGSDVGLPFTGKEEVRGDRLSNQVST